jgi:uncharacterized membrane protein YphA (DoxX/SURF4 family)
MNLSRAARTARLTAGTIFIAAGLFKLLVPGRGFQSVLEQSGAPFPAFFAVAVPLIEIVGGISLIRNKVVRFFSALLAANISGAIVLVGLPGARGRAFSVGEYSIGREVWRLPLEATLLFITLWTALRRPKNAQKLINK